MKDFWNQKFGETPNLYGELPNEYLKEKLKNLRVGKILFPGEGEGRNAIYAAQKGWDVLAIDQSDVARQNALKLSLEKDVKITYQVMDMLDFKCDEEFDAIALIYFHLPLNLIEQIHKKLSSCLKKGGVVIVEGFGKNQHEYSSGGPKDIEMRYDLVQLKKSFPNFEWLEEFDGIVNLTEGTGHVGKAHVIRLFGTKI